ncbi:hypothetical protein [Hymenobacter coalescens]
MPLSLLRAPLRLVPAGQYAHVYRRSRPALGVRGPHRAQSVLDRSHLPMGAPAGYVVLYYDPACTTGVAAATPVVQAGAAPLPPAASLLHLG